MGVPVVLGGLVGSICFEDQATWYRTLKRPFWEPPPPVFGQVHGCVHKYPARSLTCLTIRLAHHPQWPEAVGCCKRVCSYARVNIRSGSGSAMTPGPDTC